MPQNVGNWQWVAGTGPDAAPYFRVFNPTLQSAKFDPQAAYIRRWVPELAPLDDRAIHEPSKLGPLELVAARITLDADYPSPIVDHAAARLRAIDAYKAARTRTPENRDFLSADDEFRGPTDKKSRQGDENLGSRTGSDRGDGGAGRVG